MTDDHTYYRWMAQKAQIRAGARAIILNASGDRFLVQKNLSARDGYFNFIGEGG